jgi:hypothetical protein
MQFNFNTLLIPLASSMVGLIPVLINLSANFLDKKSLMARRNNEMNYVNQRVTFLTSWYQLQKEISRPEHLQAIKDMVSLELKDVYDDLTDALIDADKLSQQRQELMIRYKKTNAFRRFLLLYTPYNFGGWMYHTLFYMTLIPWATFLGYEVYQYVQTGSLFQNQLYLYAGIALTVLVILFRILGRGAAKSTEQRLATLDRKTIPLGRQATSTTPS